MNLQNSGAVCRENAETHSIVVPAQAGTQYSVTSVIESRTRGVLDPPPSRGMTAVRGAIVVIAMTDGDLARFCGEHGYKSRPEHINH